MARNPASLSNRLKKLKAARQRIWSLQRGMVMTAIPMAQALGVSWPVLRAWCDELDGFEASGAFERGANGSKYEFCPVRTLWFLTDHFEAEAARRSEKNRDLQESAGVSLPEDEEASSFEETRGLVNLTLAVVAAAREQGHYTPTAQMIDFIEGYNQRLVNAILGIRTVADPNGALPAKIRTEIDGYLRDVASDVHEEAVKFIEEQRADLQPSGTARTGKPALNA